MLPEDAARMLPQCSAPRIGRFIVEDGEPFYYIFVEQKPLLQCQSLFKAFSLWFMVHYVFNLSYHKYQQDLGYFLQQYVFGMPDDPKKKKGANFLRIVTGVLRSTS